MDGMARYCVIIAWSILAWRLAACGIRFDKLFMGSLVSMKECPLLSISLITLSQGKYAIVDTADYEWLNQWKWSACANGKNWYASRSIGKEPHRSVLCMHRLLCEAGPQRDHINNNGLDNRRCNLRPCTTSQNAQNGQYVSSNSGYRGVSLEQGRRRFRGYIKKDKKTIHLGMFDDPKEAALAYNQKAKELFGEFASLNVIV
jgi:hypothetical protein